MRGSSEMVVKMADVPVKLKGRVMDTKASR